MEEWERRARLRIDEAAEVRRFVEAKAREAEAGAREVEARAALQRADTARLTEENRINQINRANSQMDGYLMAVAQNRVQQEESITAHVREILERTQQ
ncbi:hypothetical protein SPF06_19655 [Sinomonas sp. JGH33]|uniref:Uncharacterized protein n=1 Tax=Sinomonas terricola TaxID=3110330 RepID=A0ABU5TBT0_9MICC|nr:hypothetical protein [Sinomonas sp. JGH33]MEA5456944.1 hypothetical protein [Sinomonas sp. JGH33]